MHIFVRVDDGGEGRKLFRNYTHRYISLELRVVAVIVEAVLIVVMVVRCCGGDGAIIKALHHTTTTLTHGIKHHAQHIIHT